MINKSVLKNFGQLAFLLELKDLSYNLENKEEFKRTGLKCMRTLAKLLELKEYKVEFNPGGIAVSGELYLYGMWDNYGINIVISQDGHETIMYRKIEHMKDYKGGVNHWSYSKNLLNLPNFIDDLKNIW